MKKIIRCVNASAYSKSVYQIDDITEIAGTPCIRVGSNKCYLSELITAENAMQKSH